MLWLTAYLITQLVEVPIYVLALGNRARWQRPLVALGASTLTHPVVWVTTGRLAALISGGGITDSGWWIAVSMTETFAVLVEAAYLRAFGLKRAFLWSLGANGASFGTGLLLQAFGIWP